MQIRRTQMDWSARFLFALRWGDGLAQSSLLCVDYELLAWQRWLFEHGLCWSEITASHIKQWLAELNPEYAAATVNKRIWVLRRLYRWAVEERLIAADPWLTITRPRSRRTSKPRYVPTVAEIDRLLAQPDVYTAKGVRDRAILELLYASGLRAAELIALQCHQLNTGSADRYIRIRGKGGRERVVVYGHAAADWLRQYWNHARPVLLCKAGAMHQFFVNDTPSGVFHYRNLHYAVKRYARSAGLPGLTTHSLRHAFATHLYENGANLRVIQMLLGHRCLATTSMYAVPSRAKLKKVIEKHHPRGSRCPVAFTSARLQDHASRRASA